MKCDRKEVLQKFLKSESLIEKSMLTKDELEEVTFSTDSKDLLVEAIKKLIFSYCNDDSDLIILRNINSKIAK